MKHSLSNFRDTGSFFAGLLIGVSILVPVFAMMGANTADWLTLLVFAAPAIFALGLALQLIVTAELRHQRTI